MAKSPAYRWYPKDILGSLRVGSMTAAEECWYRRALDFSWLNEGLPANPKMLARIIGKQCTTRGAELVLTMFEPSQNPDIYINERQEIERQKQKEWSEKSASGGKKSKPPQSKENGSKSEPPLEANPEPKVNIPFAYAFAGDSQEESKPLKPPLREIFLGTVTTKIAQQLGLKKLPDTLAWHKCLDWAFENDFSAEAVIETFDLMRKQSWRTGPITPKSLADNLPNLENLRIEIGNTGNGHSKLPTLAEVEAERTAAMSGPRKLPPEKVKS